MSDDLAKRIGSLDDKQACFIATKLGRDLMAAWKERPTFDALAAWTDRESATEGVGLQLAATPDWNSRSLKGEEAGRAARAVLLACAADDALAPVVSAALDHYGRDERADLGVLSVPIALGLTYLLVAADVDVNLPFVRLKKKGLSGKQQVAAIKNVIPALAKLIQKLYST
jgi:hypothetical protein